MQCQTSRITHCTVENMLAQTRTIERWKFLLTFLYEFQYLWYLRPTPSRSSAAQATATESNSIGNFLYFKGHGNPIRHTAKRYCKAPLWYIPTSYISQVFLGPALNLVVAWCRADTARYLNQCWPNFPDALHSDTKLPMTPESLPERDMNILSFSSIFFAKSGDLPLNPCTYGFGGNSVGFSSGCLGTLLLTWFNFNPSMDK